MVHSRKFYCVQVADRLFCYSERHWGHKRKKTLNRKTTFVVFSSSSSKWVHRWPGKNPDLGRPFRLTSGSVAFMGRNLHQEQCFTDLVLCGQQKRRCSVWNAYKLHRWEITFICHCFSRKGELSLKPEHSYRCLAMQPFPKVLISVGLSPLAGKFHEVHMISFSGKKKVRSKYYTSC